MPVIKGQAHDTTISRRRAVTSIFGAWAWLPAMLEAADGNEAVRLAISQNLVADVNITDARAAMLVWIKRMMADLNVMVDINPRVFDTTEEIVSRARSGQLDSVALNVVEYRQIEDLLDGTQILAGAGAGGTEQYVLLAKRNGGTQPLGSLRGRRLCVSTAPKMCIALPWLSTILSEANLGSSEQFFASVASEGKASRVILPVFFGKTDACLTSRRDYDTMCELNPQVKDLVVIATSLPMIVTCYAFHKNYRRASRERFIKALAGVRGNAAGRQLATMFQFDELIVQDGGCLSAALDVLKKGEHSRGRPAPGGRKG